MVELFHPWLWYVSHSADCMHINYATRLNCLANVVLKWFSRALTPQLNRTRTLVLACIWLFGVENPQWYCQTRGMNQVKCGMDDIEKEVEGSKVTKTDWSDKLADHSVDCCSTDCCSTGSTNN